MRLKRVSSSAESMGIYSPRSHGTWPRATASLANNRSIVRDLFHGAKPPGTSADVGCNGDSEIRLVSALCDDRLLPHKIFLLRLPLTDGQFTRENWLTLRIFTMRDCVTTREVIEHHTAGWPRDFFTQLAVALD